MSRYDDIIDLPRPVSAERSHMSMHDRAAQFSPFAALVGYGDAVSETVRLTDEKTELTEDKCGELDKITAYLLAHKNERPFITVEYFIPDEKKQGGRYEVFSGNLRTVDEYGRSFIFTCGRSIPMDDIYNIEVRDLIQ